MLTVRVWRALIASSWARLAVMLEGLAEAGIDLLALRRQAHAMAEALEQDDAGARLQSPELLAYRAGSDAHGRGRAGEIAMAGGFDESA